RQPSGDWSRAARRLLCTALRSGRRAGVLHGRERGAHSWRGERPPPGGRRGVLLPDAASYVLLAAVIEGADRVANTAGVYAAYIKQWQPNAVRPLTIVAEAPISSRERCVAHQADAAQVAEALGTIDLLYVDPPYNTRQYAGYYHVPELIARGWFDADIERRGNTGLISDADQM